MTRCANCGLSNPHGMTTCYACAKPVREVVSRPLDVSIRCDNCNSPNLTRATACWICGNPLQSAWVETPDEMTRSVQAYDAGLSCEEPTVLNHRLCLGNKIFTYLAAGVPVILSRTPAQAALADDLGPAAFTYECGDVAALASVFCRLSTSEALRRQSRDGARAAAVRRWHWEHPLDRGALVDLVRNAIS